MVSTGPRRPASNQPQQTETCTEGRPDQLVWGLLMKGGVVSGPRTNRKARDQPGALGVGAGPYPMRQQVQRPPASHPGTGVSEPRPVASTPPGKSTRPRPQRSWSPVNMGTVVSISSRSLEDPILPRTPAPVVTHSLLIRPLRCKTPVPLLQDT